VATGRGEFQRLLDLPLAAHLGHVELTHRAVLLLERALEGRDRRLALHVGHRLGKVGDRIDVDPVHQGRLGGVGRGHQDPLEAPVTRGDRQWEHAPYRLHHAVER
jgi:hypothetical protein